MKNLFLALFILFIEQVYANDIDLDVGFNPIVDSNIQSTERR